MISRIEKEADTRFSKKIKLVEGNCNHQNFLNIQNQFTTFLNVCVTEIKKEIDTMINRAEGLSE